MTRICALLSTLLVLCGLVGSQAAASELVVAVRAGDPAGADTIRGELSGEGYVLGAELWTDGRYAVHLAAPAGAGAAPPEAAALRIRDMGLGGMFAIGELLHRNGDHFQAYSGKVLVEFHRGTLQSDAERWSRDHGLVLIEPDSHSARSFLFKAAIPVGQLITLQRLAGTPPVTRLTPLVYELGARARAAAVHEVFHRIPRMRNILGVMLSGGPGDWGQVRTLAESLPVTNLTDWASPLWLLRYDDENALKQIQKQMRQEQFILHTGAAVSVNPPAVMTDSLLVRFKNQGGLISWDVDLQASGIVPARVVPYIPNGFIFSYGGLGYSLYDIVTALMNSGDVYYAIPNLLTPSKNASSASCETVSGSSYHQYLEDMDLCNAWKITAAAGRQVQIGMLDEGVYAGSTSGLACSELDVGYMADFTNLSTCDPSTTAAGWCEACSNIAGGGEDHGLDVGLVIGAEHGDAKLLGIAPDAFLLSAKRHSSSIDLEYSTEVHLADSLIWMAGGDPNWACSDGIYACSGDPFPALLDESRRADVINLSFVVEDFLYRVCEDGPGACGWDEDCIVVCEDIDSCGAIEEALKVLRDPSLFPESRFDQSAVRSRGTVVVAAVGDYGSVPTNDCSAGTDFEGLCYADSFSTNPSHGWIRHTDLAESPNTIAIGSVYGDGKPYNHEYSKYCWNHWQGDFLDVVAPLGGHTNRLSTNPDVEFGASSAATAAVSGIAALMLKVNPLLTPDQIQCILRETADTGLFDDIPEWDYSEDCRVASGYSPCVGYGQVDAYRAVLMAQACYDPAVMVAEGPWLGPFREVSGDHITILAPDEATIDLSDHPGSHDADDGLVVFQPSATLLDALRPHCPCTDAEEGDTGRLIQFTMTAIEYKQPVDLEVNEDVIRVLECLANGKCTCLLDPDCIRFDLINEYEDIWHDVTFRMCIRDRCWEMPGRFEEWLPGQEVTVPAVIDEMIPAMWRATGEYPVIRAFSNGNRIPPVGR